MDLTNFWLALKMMGVWAIFAFIALCFVAVTARIWARAWFSTKRKYRDWN